MERKYFTTLPMRNGNNANRSARRIKMNMTTLKTQETEKRMNRIFKWTIMPVLLFVFGATAMAQTEIRTAKELAAIGADNNSLEKSYLLMNDITVDNWTPIGDIDSEGRNSFNGIFDGNGHTVTINGFNAEPDNTRVGLFGLTGAKGVVKNLHVAGKVNYTGGQKFLYIGGIVGFNSGLITCCVSSINLTSNHVKAEGKKEAKHQFGYEVGQFGGGIAGINLGTIIHCYSTGLIQVLQGQAAGIAAGNGKPIAGSISISIGSGGGGISASPGAIPQERGEIAYCYSTASVLSSVDVNKSVLNVVSGGACGIVAINRIETARMHHCVSLNRLLEARGYVYKKIPEASPFPVFGSAGLTHQNSQFYYCENIVTSRYDDRNIKQKPSKMSPKCAVPLLTVQEESWWCMPDGLTKKEQQKVLGFPFGDDETSPWKWSGILKRPILYWETSTPEGETQETWSDPDAGILSEKTETAMVGGKLSPDITWRMEGETLIISGTGEMPGSTLTQRYADILSDGASVIIEDGITSVCHHAFATSKISSVVLGADVAKLGTYAFFNCNNLVRVEVKSTTPPKVGMFAFMSTPIGKVTLVVPVGAKTAYEKNGGWKKFGTIEERKEE
jgi:hypothetical protein